MKLKYAAIDIETTSLDPDRGQVIELAVVAETDWRTPVAELPRLHLLVEHDVYRGDAAAIAMNSRVFDQLMLLPEHRDTPAVWGDDRDGQLDGLVQRFLDLHFSYSATVTAAGKSYASFDARFLERLPGWPARRFRRRVLDPGSLYLDPAADDRLPDTAACLARAGLTNDRPHHPVADCLAVIEMIRKHYAGRG